MRFLPRTEAFFDHLEEEAKLLDHAASELLALSGGANASKESSGSTERLLKAIEDSESRCAELTNRTVAALRVTFLTPLDRDDLFVLATALECVATALAAAAHAVALSGAGAVDGVPVLAKATHAAVHALAAALGKMRDAKHRDPARASCDAARKASRESERARRTFARSLDASSATATAQRLAGDALGNAAARAAEAADAIEAALLDA